MITLTPNERAARIGAQGGPLDANQRNYFRRALRQLVAEPRNLMEMDDRELCHNYLQNIIENPVTIAEGVFPGRVHG